MGYAEEYLDVLSIPGVPNNSPSTSPPQQPALRSQADDARAYRREHDLCFYCGGKFHALKDCHFAPHNRVLGVHVPPEPQRNNSTSTADSDRSTPGSPVSNLKLNGEEYMTPPATRPDPGLLRRLGIAGPPPTDLTDSQWAECLNAHSDPPEHLRRAYLNVTVDAAIVALKCYSAIRFPDPPTARTPSPHLAYDKAERCRIGTEVRNWECLPRETKAAAIESVKRTAEEKLMAALDVVGEKIMKEAPMEIKLQFKAVLEFCVKD